jgi:hypothetical protein
VRFLIAQLARRVSFLARVDDDDRQFFRQSARSVRVSFRPPGSLRRVCS